MYLTLSRNTSIKVRKTLAASLGELARVIGPENARRDLVDVWWDAMRCAEDGDVRLKAIEALPLFVSALGEGEARDTIFSGLVKIWEEGWLRNWRAREGIIKIIPDLAGAAAHPECVHRILRWGLEDDFGAVREVSISVVSKFTPLCFATSRLFRSRTCGEKMDCGVLLWINCGTIYCNWLMLPHFGNA